MQAVSASPIERQNQIDSLPKNRGRTAIKMGGQMTLRESDTISAFSVRRVDCQNEIIRIL